MSGSSFFIEKNITSEPETKFSTRSRIFIVAAVSILYGAIAIAVGGLLQMSGTSLIGVGSVYFYGILGGFAILMLKRIFARSEENRKLLFDVLDRDPNAHAITNRDGEYVYSNKSWLRIYGESDKVSHQNVAEHFIAPYKLRQQLQVYTSKYKSDAPAPDFIFVDKTADDSKWVKLTIHPISGWPEHRQWFLHDVTYEYQAQQVSQEHYNALKDLFGQVPVGLCCVNAAGELCDVNNRLLTLLGKPAEPIKLHDIFTEKFDEDCAKHSLSIEQNDTGVHSGSYKIKTADGGERQVFVMHDVCGAAGDNIRGYAAFFELGQQRISKIASSSHGDATYFEDVFVGAPLGMCTVSSNMEITHYNDRFLELIGRDGVENMTLTAFVDKTHHETLKQWVEQLVDAEDTQKSIDIELLQKKGKLSTRVYAHRMSDTDVLVCFIDLTQQKNLEQQFSQSQKMQGIGQLAGGIAHDFNNLLTAMIGFCDLLLLRHKPGDPSFSDIMHIKQNANRASNLVRQLLAFSRQQTLQPKILDITDVLSELSHLLQRLIGANIQMNMKHGQDLWPVKCDEGQLEQVLINLAVNARDAMNNGGKLDIITENYQNKKLENLNDDEYLPPGEWVLIKVQDNGTGIPRDVMERIFEPFFSTKEIGAGTGLGLSTVHGIVHQTGGFLGVESVVNEGTTFTIYLPHHKAGDKAAEASKAEEKEKAAQKDETAEDLTGSAAILLVEDEAAVRTFSSRALSNKGYKIIDAENGEVALEIIEKQKIDLELLVTDVIMPEMDGPTTAKHLRRLYPDLKIIFMSGYSEDRFKEEFGKNTHFLQKPFTLQQLAKKVKDVLDEE